MTILVLFGMLYLIIGMYFALEFLDEGIEGRLWQGILCVLLWPMLFME